MRFGIIGIDADRQDDERALRTQAVGAAVFVQRWRHAAQALHKERFVLRGYADARIPAEAVTEIASRFGLAVEVMDADCNTTLYIQAEVTGAENGELPVFILPCSATRNVLSALGFPDSSFPVWAGVFDTSTLKHATPANVD
jgi:hypothetical protein